MSFDPSGYTTRARVADIIALASDIFMVPREQITGSQRNPRYVRARFAVSAVAQEQGHSYPMIGRAMNRDHSTIIYGVRKAGKMMETDEGFCRRVQHLRDLARTAKPFVADRLPA